MTDQEVPEPFREGFSLHTETLRGLVHFRTNIDSGPMRTFRAVHGPNAGVPAPALALMESMVDMLIEATGRDGQELIDEVERRARAWLNS